MSDKHAVVNGFIKKASSEEAKRTGFSTIVAVFGFIAGKEKMEEIDKEFFDDDCDLDDITDFCGDVGSSWAESHGAHTMELKIIEVDMFVAVPALAIGITAGLLTYNLLKNRRNNARQSGLQTAPA